MSRSLILIIMVVVIIMLSNQVQSHTINNDVKETGHEATKRHDVYINDSKNDSSKVEDTQKEMYKRNNCINGTKSLTDCIELATASTSTKKYNFKAKMMAKLRNLTKLYKANSMKFLNKNSDARKNTTNFSENEINALKLKEDTTTLNKTNETTAPAPIHDERKNGTTHLLTTRNETGIFKVIPLLDAVKNMLTALDKLLGLAINNGNNPIKYDSNSTTQPKLRTQTSADDNPIQMSNNELQNIKSKQTSNDITVNENKISKTSDLIDNAIESLLNAEILKDPVDNLQFLQDGFEINGIHTIIAKTDRDRLYKWCLRLIQAEKSREKSNFKYYINQNDMVTKSSSNVITYSNSKNLHTNEDENITKFINSVLDCIGFVNTMQNLHQTKKNTK